MPSASDRAATNVNAGLFASIRNAWRTSCAYSTHRVGEPDAARVAIVLFHLADAAEFHPGAADRFLTRHAGRHVLLDLTIEMKSQLVVEVAIAGA